MFEGAYTALITPFAEDGSVDFEAFNQLIQAQIDGGMDGIVPVGTTGESPTLEMSEHKQVIEAAVAAAQGKVKVIAGTGGNSTHEALELTRFAKEAGADGTLQVTPYYNKPTQEGLFRHLSTIADVGLPVVLYNVPGRSSTELSVDTVVRLAEHPNVTTMKEASGDVTRVSQYRRYCDIEVISGDDGMTLPMMAAGGVGVISVASNIVPDRVSRMVHLAAEGKWAEALVAHDEIFPLYEDMFIETNPIPVKEAYAILNNRKATFRLPLCEMSEEKRAILIATMKQVGVL